MGRGESLINMCVLPWKTPNFSTLCHRQKDSDVIVQYHANDPAPQAGSKTQRSCLCSTQ
ncbi:hypothetical protein [Lampropedia puyangensis]|uniref:hypothetical protein n=1 Tax=Lampropedia puyangensis TaxID=1330072 RepID=UPI003CC7F601